MRTVFQIGYAFMYKANRHIQVSVWQCNFIALLSPRCYAWKVGSIDNEPVFVFTPFEKNKADLQRAASPNMRRTAS